MSRNIHHTNRWTIGEWQFFEIDGRSLAESFEGRKLFGFTANTVDADGDKVQEWFNTLEHAMAAAIAEKYTGRRGASGSGVGTAADWFMRMLGVGHLQEAGPDGGRALAEALHASDGFPPVGPAGFANRIERTLESKGIVLARQAVE